MLTAAQILHGLTAIFFGVYWPILIVQTWRTGRNQGPPLLVMTVFMCAYSCLVISMYLQAAALQYTLGWPIILYWIDLSFVALAYVTFLYHRIVKPELQK